MLCKVYFCGMRLTTSYKQILTIAAPIMIGSAAQNIITLTDRWFVHFLGEDDFASIGFVSVFYLIVAAIGFGFSRGGQILIARKAGEQEFEEAGKTFHSVFLFEFFLSIILFLFMTFGSFYLFDAMLESDNVLDKGMAYLSTRKWGVFFSYTGVALIALYTGIARPKFLIFDTFLLGAVNIALDYALIFGNWGFPKMGIAGAGLASTIAEIVAFVVFIIYMIQDKKIRVFKIWRMPQIDWQLIREQYKLSIPLVVQPIVGLGSWLIFMAIVEMNLGERALAVTILIQMVYLVLSIPSWGFAAGVSTLTGGFIGHKKRQAVIPIIWKTGRLSFVITMALAIPVALFPEFFLAPFFDDQGAGMVMEAKPVLFILVAIMAVFSYGSAFFSGVAGVGSSAYGLKIQCVSAVMYLSLIYFVIKVWDGGIIFAWAAEICYWLVISIWSLHYLYSQKWHGKLK